MNQYTSNSRQNRNRNSRAGSSYGSGRTGRPGYDPGRSEFMTVLLFYVLPFIVVNLIIFVLVTATPKGTLTIGDTSDYLSTTIVLKVKSLLPIKTPVITLDGNPVEFQKTGSGTYEAVLTSNGGLEADLICINQMKSVLYEQVSVLDDAPPAIDQAIMEDGVLSFHIDDSQSGVDYSSIYASDDTRDTIMPLSIDRSTGLITFDMASDTLNVHVKDVIGNELSMIFDPNGESTVEGVTAETMQGANVAGQAEETETSESSAE